MATIKETRLKNPKILIAGESGAGKTALALTLGESAQILDCDDGCGVALGLKDGFTEARQSVDYVDCTDKNPEKPEGWKKLQNTIMGIGKQAREGKYPFGVTIVDSLTVMTTMARRAHNASLKLQLNEWGEMINEFETLLWKIRSLPHTVVVIAHMMREEIEGRVQQCVAVEPKSMIPKMPRIFDEAWYMSVDVKKGEEKGKRLLQTQPSTSVQWVKSRRGLGDMTDTSKGMRGILDNMNVVYEVAEPMEFKDTGEAPIALTKAGIAEAKNRKQ